MARLRLWTGTQWVDVGPDAAEIQALMADSLNLKLDKAAVRNEPDMVTGSTTDPPSQASVVAYITNLIGDALNRVLPSGGKWYQILGKASADNYDVQWVDPPNVVIPLLLAPLGGSIEGMDRDGVAGTQIGAAQAANGAIAADVETTNWVHNPTGQPGGRSWVPSNCTVTQDTDVTKNGVPSLRFTVSGPGAAYATNAAPDSEWAPGDIPYSGVWARTDSPGAEVRLRVYYFDTGTTLLLAQEAPYVTLPDTDWHYVANNTNVPMVPGGARIRTMLAIRDGTVGAGDQVWFCQPIVTKNAPVTSFTPLFDDQGALLPGHAWTGTPYDSPSTRQAGYLETRLGDISPVRGSAMFRVKRYRDTTDEAQYQIFGAGHTASGDVMSLRFSVAGDLVLISYTSGTGNQILTSSAIVAADGEYHDVYIEWDGADVGIAVDDGPLETSTREYAGFWHPGSRITLGARSYDGGYIFNGEIAGAIVYDRPLTTGERAALRAADAWAWDAVARGAAAVSSGTIGDEFLVEHNPDGTHKDLIMRTADGVTGIGVDRIIASRNPDEPLIGGDLLVVVPSEAFFTDFSEHPTGATPPDWTLQWLPAGSGAEVVDEAGAVGGKVLRLTGSTAGRFGMSWDVVSGSLQADQRIEVVYKWRVADGTPGSMWPGLAAAVLASGELGSQDMITGGRIQNVRGTIRISRYIGGSAGSIQNAEITAVNDTWYITRFRFDSGVASLNEWPAGDPEPNTWLIEDWAVPTPKASGWAGLVLFEDGEIDIDFVGVSVGGGTAPTEEV